MQRFQIIFLNRFSSYAVDCNAIFHENLHKSEVGPYRRVESLTDTQCHLTSIGRISAITIIIA